MVESFKNFWKNYFNFSGRATRSEYGFMLLWYLLILVVLNYVPSLLIIWLVATIIPWLALQIRRYRDVGFNNWGIGLIYIFNVLLVITMFYLVLTVFLKVGTSLLGNGLLTIDTISSKESVKEVLKQYGSNEGFIAYMTSVILESSVPLVLFHIYVFFYQVFLFVCSFLPTNFLVGKSFFDFTRKEEPKDEILEGYLASDAVDSALGKQGVRTSTDTSEDAEAFESSEEVVSDINTDVETEEDIDTNIETSETEAPKEEAVEEVQTEAVEEVEEVEPTEPETEAPKPEEEPKKNK